MAENELLASISMLSFFVDKWLNYLDCVLIWGNLGLKFNKMSKNMIFAISDDFQHLV